MTTMNSFRRQTFREGKALLNSPPDVAWRGVTENARPLGQAKSLSIERQSIVVFSVLRLLLWSGPSAIAGFISTIIVNPIERHARRATAHVVEKVGVRLPAVADANASIKVAVSISRIRLASSFHRRPLVVFLVALSSRRSAVGSISGQFKASTTLGVPTKQFVAGNHRGLTAGAATEPHDVSTVTHSRLLDNCQQSEISSGQVVHIATYLASMWSWMMRLTSSATEMPRRLASFFKYAVCGSVKEIICLISVVSPHNRTKQACRFGVNLWVGENESTRPAVKSTLVWFGKRVIGDLSHKRDPFDYGCNFKVIEWVVSSHTQSIPRGIQWV